MFLYGDEQSSENLSNFFAFFGLHFLGIHNHLQGGLGGNMPNLRVYFLKDSFSYQVQLGLLLSRAEIGNCRSRITSFTILCTIILFAGKGCKCHGKGKHVHKKLLHTIHY